MGTQRIEDAFQKGKTAFITYSMLGYPDKEASLDVMLTLQEAGADLLELGIPFSDPLADGPTIQAAGQVALEHGTSLTDCLEMVRDLRNKGLHIPAVFMTYINPIIAYGIEKFVADCAAAGLDGFIVPDLPPEEAEEMDTACHEHDMALIYLLAPNSPADRIELVVEKARGFIYLVSLIGVTGARDELPKNLADFVQRVRKVTDKNLSVGFGIGSGEQARMVAGLADGVIVGSALVKLAAKSREQVYDLACEIREGIDSAVTEKV